MIGRGYQLAGWSGVAMLLALAAAAPAAGPQADALTRIEPGRWQLHETGAPPRDPVCIRDAASLIQIHHLGAQCSRFVVASSREAVTVHYTCPGHGHARTTITVETPRLIRVETQGIDAGAPFSLDLEGRRVGDCGQPGRTR